ncbi:iron chelate uptake ABC transporter family permease subunit [Amycolatopsis acidiphila]|uniref:Iron chelate uptake ABC transporter family permease subunit n=1 Tax=Amycolatopsis acidiphila TaxID=715473 RepID=A0A557ZZA6_9PSEU|nr:iron chelate uptake ABC transporter family permease subunit [Amycolatopsis acidiphila]TVT17346.1 iron chelate uptake ABC transporter family permease subunit [Amycolatopsis acidiphila]UIJ60641.1 iron chelate uptake ABC transporter family permease subunit [Amycolatopsis acidiphila]GHG98328.1 iron ABC transporter permease [Amycolatopsis acidiphila]
MAVSTPQASGQRSSSRAFGLVVGLALLAFACLASLWVGAKGIPFTATWDLLWHNDGSSEAVIIHDLRVPRTLLGLLVGAGLGLGGALMQALTRNPLADPGLLGVNMGASAAVVVAIGFLEITTLTGYLWFALAGAAVAAVLAYLLGTAGHGSAAPERLVLAGAAVTAVLFAFVQAVLLLNPLTFNQFRFWDVGSLASRRMDVVAQVAPFIVAGVVLALSQARALNALALGDQAGKALGAHLGRTRALVAVAVTLLCGAATAAAGPITFVGLAVPHAARLLVGPDQRWVLPYSMVLAPILLIGSDIVGRVIGGAEEVEVGIVTAIIGAPVFVLLCRRRKLARL